jgi:hypothetical protein
MRLFYNICYHNEIRLSQFAAVFPQILTKRAEKYCLYYVSPENDFYGAYMKIKMYFDTNVNYRHYYTNWTTITYNKAKQENHGFTL